MWYDSIEKFFSNIKNNLQLTGALLMVFVFISAIMGWTFLGWGTAIIVGLIDLYLIYILKAERITQWIRGLTGHTIDNIILIGLIVLVWALKGPDIALWFFLGSMNTHFFEMNK
jgi:hypothetical protein